MKPNRRILLVEDSSDEEVLTLRAFEKNQMFAEVVVARDGPEALGYLFGSDSDAGCAGKTLPQVILLDLKLPKIDGLEVLRRIRADGRTQFLPVVVLTSSEEAKDIIDSYRAGANSYVRKPVDFSRFLELMRDIAHYWLARNEAPPGKMHSDEDNTPRFDG